jgi:hypothetical protein
MPADFENIAVAGLSQSSRTSFLLLSRYERQSFLSAAAFGATQGL